MPSLLGKEPLYSWLVAAGCFGLSFLTVGLHRSAGVLYVAVLHVFDVTREHASWPFSLCGALMCLLGPLAGFLSHYFSIRSILVSGVLISALAIALCFFTPSLLYLILFFGLFRGIGNGLIVTLNPVLIHQHFTHQKATATGIAYAGASVGSFALPPLIEWLLANYGFNGCFLLIGALMLNGLLAAFVAKEPDRTKKTAVAVIEPQGPTTESLLENKPPPQQQAITMPAESCDYKLLERPVTLLQKMQARSDGVFGQFRHTAQILGSPLHLAMCLTFGCNVVNFIAFLTVVVDFARDRGVAEAEAVLLVSAFSVGDLFGAVCLGWLSDRGGCVGRRGAVASSFAIMAGLLFYLPYCPSQPFFLGVSACVGVFTGCVMTNIPVLMREYLGLERLAVAVGLAHFFVGVGQLIFPTLIGYFRDNVGSYDHLFTTLGAMCLICSLLWVIEPLLKKIKPLA